MKLHFSFKDISLKQQLLILVIIAILSVIITQLISFNVFNNITHDNMASTTNVLLNQLEENISIHATSIKEIGNTIAYNNYVQKFMGSTNYYQRSDYVKFIDSLFDYFLLSNSNIKEILLIDSLGRVTSSKDYTDWNMIKTIQATDPPPANQGEFNVLMGENSVNYIYSLNFLSVSNMHNSQFLYIIFENDSLQRLLTHMEISDSSTIFLINDNNTILAATDANEIGNSLDPELTQIINTTNDSTTVKYHGQSSMINNYYIPDMSWSLISIVPDKDLTRPLESLKTFGIIYFLIFLVILGFIYYIIVSNITRPIVALSAFMENVDYNTLKSQVFTTGKNEVDQVIVKVNDMLKQIQQLTKKIFTTQQQYYEMELEKRHAEFSALQNQINPHFLYNTLDCIRSIAFTYDAKEIVSITSSMSKIFRYCIHPNYIVTISEELDSIENYINIIQVRYKERFHIEKQIDERLQDQPIIKFVLQPIIENAICHGLEMKLGHGTLKITGEIINAQKYYFEIFDTGVGIPDEKLQFINKQLGNPEELSLKNSNSLGLYNINKRIKNAYGSSFGLHIESKDKEWTKVTLNLGTDINPMKHYNS